MKRYLVHFFQPGGCDYTIACGHKIVPLPEKIATMEQAVAYVTTESGDPPRGCIHYYGRDQIEKCTIYEVVGSRDVSFAELDRLERERRQAEEKEKRRAEYEKLKQEFESE